MNLPPEFALLRLCNANGVICATMKACFIAKPARDTPAGAPRRLDFHIFSDGDDASENAYK